MRNRMIYQATFQIRSKQLGSSLSKDLQKKYGKKSTRAIVGDTITILRGEFKGVSGKITKISTEKTSVTIEGVKKEKTKGDKFDVYIHTSNVVVTSLNTSDKWRISKLEGKDPKKQTSVKQESKVETKETKVETKVVKKDDEK